MSEQIVKQDTFDHIYDLLRHRLNVIGPIRTDDAWQVCRFKTKYSYTMICLVFRKCINTMIEQGKAIRTEQKGRYKIIKPNERAPIKN